MAVVCAIMYIGDVVTIKSKGWIPSLLAISVLFLAGYWTFFPKDILDISMMSSLKNIMLLVILIHVGAMFSVKQLKKDIASVVTTLAAMVGICVLAGAGGMLLFGKQSALTAVPPLTGGGMASLLMSDAAIAKGLPELAMLSTIIFTMQGFVGFPATIFFIKKEAARLIKGYRDGTSILTVSEDADDEGNTRKTFNDMVPEKYKTPAYYFLKLSFLACIAYVIGLTPVGKVLNSTILSLVIGFIAGHFGFLEQNPIGKAQSFGILQLGLIASMMQGFATSTPEIIFSLLLPTAVYLILATAGIMLLSVPVGKKFGYSPYMSIAIGLNCFLGFPYNFALTNEGISAVATNEAETEYLTKLIMPKMIIGGVISVSVVSAIIAGFLAPLL